MDFLSFRANYKNTTLVMYCKQLTFSIDVKYLRVIIDEKLTQKKATLKADFVTESLAQP